MNMRLRLVMGVASVMIGLTAGAAAPLLAQRPALAMLNQLERGSWELRTREAGGRVERICLRDPRRLIQLRHPADNCEPLIVSDTDGEVTVQYTCRGKGYGRTQIRRESNRLVQIDSQGIADGLPFDFSAEARRVGDCAA
jgi:hypothetical protein